jgi:hypothetical protein
MDTSFSRRSDERAERPRARFELTEEERRRIRERALEIVVERLGQPTRKYRTYWRWGSKEGLKVNFAGAHSGTFFDWDGEVHGDMIAWIQREYGCRFLEAKEIALQERAPDPYIAKAKAKAAVEKAVDQSAFARQQISHSRPLLNTLAAKYLIEYRGIPTEVVHALDTAGVIRFLPQYKTHPNSVYTSPAFAVVVTDLDGKVHGLQAVRLQRTGQKREGKDAKRSHGALKDNAAAGWLSLKGWDGGDVVLAEGPEDALTVYAARPDALVGAALGGIKRLVLAGAIPRCRRIIIAAQNDAPDSPSAKSLREACDMLVAEGFEVLLAYPPAGIKDANDLLRSRGIEAVRAMLDSARPVLPPQPPKGKADEVLADIDAATKPQPYWPRVDQDAIAASARLEELVEKWMCDAERWLDAFDYKAEQTKAFINDAMTPKEKRAVRRQIMDNVRAKFPDVDLKVPPRIQIVGSAGLGKSSAVRKAFMKHPRLWKRQFHGFLPTLKLADEFETEMKELIGPSLPAPLVASHKGRSHSCLRSKTVAEKLAGMVRSSYSATCDNGEVQCQFHDQCAYPASWMIQGPGMHLFAHDFLVLPKILKFPRADFAFIDEDATESLLSIGGRVPASVLAEPLTYQTAAITNEQADAASLGARVMAAITSGKPMLAELRKAGITRKDLRTLADWAEPTEQAPDINPGMSDKQIEALLPSLQTHNGELAARVFRHLSRELRQDRAEANGVVYFSNSGPAKTDRDRERQGKIELYRRKEVRGVPKGIPLLIIDADADLETNRLFHGSSLIGHEITAPRKGRVTQINNASLPKTSLIPELVFEAPTDETLESAQALRASIIAYITACVAGGKRVLVGVNKGFRRFVTGEPDGKLSAGFDIHGATWTHYGAILGVDKWKHYDVIVLIGRDQMPAEAAEAQARALYYDQPDTLNLTGEYRKVTRYHRMRNGSAVGVEVHVHDDPRVQRRVEAKRERGMCQMIDRLRLVHGADDRQIIILSNLPLPGIEVDEMTKLSHVLECRTPQQELCRLIEFAHSRWGVLPLVPKFLAENASKIVSSTRTAERMVAELNDPINRQFLIRYYKLGTGGLSPARFWRTSIGQKRPSNALFFGDRPSGIASLEALFGPVAVQGGGDDATSQQQAEPVSPVQEVAAPIQAPPDAAAKFFQTSPKSPDAILAALKALKRCRAAIALAVVTEQTEPGELEEDFEQEMNARRASIQQNFVAAWGSENAAEYRRAAENPCQTRYNADQIKPLGELT